jgi:CRISPR-associated endonuclease Csn1
MGTEERESLAQLLREEDDLELVEQTLARNGLSDTQAKSLATKSISNTRSAAGITATNRIAEELVADVIDTYTAAQRVGYDDASQHIPTLSRLPYYGVILEDHCVGASMNPADLLEKQFGKIPNPVVHQALNRIRKIGNAFIKLYGKPSRICIELARDLNKSAADREALEAEAAKNGRTNDAYIASMLTEGESLKRRLSRSDLIKFRLHRMQNGRCLYTGQEIKVEALFDGSMEVDHILPRSKTLDDGISNLALVDKAANAHKANRPPYDAFAAGYLGRDYASILEQAKHRGPGVFWRFQPNAMEKFKGNEEFQRRFLNDTRYIGKAAAHYLSTICTDPNGIICVNGRLTSLLRRYWGLDGVIKEIMEESGALPSSSSKSPSSQENQESVPVTSQLKDRRENQKKLRLDHRHHLLDAIVAGCTRRADVKRISTLAGRFDRKPSGEELRELITQNFDTFQNVGLPWTPEFRNVVKDILVNNPKTLASDLRPATRVIHKANHSPLGQLHAQTNYGAICENPLKKGSYVVKVHKNILDLANSKKISSDLEELAKFGTAEMGLKAAIEKGSPRWWGGDAPLMAIDELKKDLNKLASDICALANEAPDEYKKKEDTRYKWAVKEYVRTTKRRRYTSISVQTVRILKGAVNEESAPRMVTATKGNLYAEVFLKSDGNHDWRVVPRLDANIGASDAPGKVVLKLYQNDIIEMLSSPLPDAERRLYRVVSISPGDFEFLPVEEARSVKESPPGFRTRLTSVQRLMERKPLAIALDHSGRIIWRGTGAN